MHRLVAFVSGAAALEVARPHKHAHAKAHKQKKPAAATHHEMVNHTAPADIIPIFVINLDSSQDRLEHMQYTLGQKKHLFNDACRISAYDFRDCKEQYKYVEMPFWEQAKRAGGTLASGMSHRRAWQMIVDKKLPVGIVMEDDVGTYSTDFDHFYAEAMATKDNWNVFRFEIMPHGYLSEQQRTKKVVENCYWHRVQRWYREDVSKFPDCFWGWGGAAYAITYEGAKEALANFNPRRDLIDAYAWSTNVQCYLPNMIAQAGGKALSHTRGSTGTQGGAGGSRISLRAENDEHLLSAKTSSGHAMVNIPSCTSRWSIPAKPLTCTDIPYGLELPVSSMNQSIYSTIPRSLNIAKDPIMKSKKVDAANAQYAAFVGKCKMAGVPKIMPDAYVEKEMKKMYDKRHQWPVDPKEYTGK